MNKKFGRLKVIKLIRLNGYRAWLCKCICGQFRKVRTSWLISKNSQSCGCYNRDRTAFVNSTTHPQRKHGFKGSSIYNSWLSMRARCNDPKNISFPSYGGRGIKVCKRWKTSFINFLKDMGEKPDQNFQIDRLNNNGNYSPKNCRWVSPKQNSNNRRSSLKIKFQNKILSLSDWARKFDLKPRTIQYRIHAGWPLTKVFFTRPLF